MSKPLTKQTSDYSDPERFLFGFFCDRCGKEWKSTVMPFSNGICSSMEKDEAVKLLWGNEHRAAFTEANLEAHFHFSCCSGCGRWVCDDCFCIEGRNYGECLDCREE